jgi:predicted NBD/HSP70 family sugar kinase
MSRSRPATQATRSGPRQLRPTAKALPVQAREHNRSLVLQSLYRDGARSRADLARLTGLTRVTISDLVADLITDGLINELGTRSGARVGKPATLLGFEPDASHIVTLDLSDESKFHGAVLDLSGNVKSRASRRREGRRGAAATALAAELAGQLAGQAERPVLGIGVGTPGVVDHAGGRVLDAPNLGWRDHDLARAIAEVVSYPVHVTNDADAAALAEHTFGGVDDTATLVIRSAAGVGAGLLLHGVLVQGERFAAGEIGHVVVEEDGVPCACGLTGCLETVLAVPQLGARLEAAADDAARARVLTDAGHRLGDALAPVISVLDLGTVVLAAPPELFDGPLREAAVQRLRSRVMPVLAEALDVRLSGLGEDGVLLGASALVLSAELGVS